MITRRSFLLGAAGLVATADLSSRSDAGIGDDLLSYGDATHAPIALDSPHGRSIPTLRSGIMTPLPPRVIAGYWTYWGSPIRLTEIPEHYNTVFLFHATPVGGAPGTTGAVQWNPPGDGRDAATNFKADLLEFRKTRTAILTVGGARANIDLSTRARAEAFLDSVQRIHSELGGFDGLDWNNYEGEQQPDTDQMIWISQELKASYGQDFAITSPPAPWRPADVRHCRAMIDAGVMDMVSPQYYDGPGLGDMDYIVDSVDEWVERMGDASRVGVGFGLADAVNYSTLADVLGAWEALSTRHPALRGAFNWDLPTDEGMGWPFAYEVGATMVSGSLTPPTPVPVIPIPPVIPGRNRTVLVETARTGPTNTPPLGLTTVNQATPRDKRFPDPVVGARWSPSTGMGWETVHPDCNVVWIELAEAERGGAWEELDPDILREAAAAGRAELRGGTVAPLLVLSSAGHPGGSRGQVPASALDAFAADVIRIVTDHGLDGFVWDLDRGPAFSPGDLARLSKLITSEMRRTNPLFSLTVSARPARGAEHAITADDRAGTEFVSRCANLIDLVQLTYCSHDHRRVGIDRLHREVQSLLDHGLREEQIGLLWRNTPTASGEAGVPPVTMDHVRHVWHMLGRTWPGLRGFGTLSDRS